MFCSCEKALKRLKMKHLISATKVMLVLGCVVPPGNSDSLDVSYPQRIRTSTFQSSQYQKSSRWLASIDTLELRGGASDVRSVLNAVDLFGTAVFAFSGAVTAGKKGMDLLGMICIATVTSIGGGTYRDVMLGSTPVFWMRQPVYLEICVVVAIATYLIWPALERKFGWKDSAKVVCISDAFGLGAFAVLGTQRAAEMDLNPVIWVVSGLVTATFGGITRDVICQEPPRSMYPYRTMYAIHPLLGSAVYATLIGKFDTQKDTSAIISFLLICFTRILSFNSSVRLPHWNQKTCPTD